MKQNIVSRGCYIDEHYEERYHKFYPLVKYNTRTLLFKNGDKHSSRYITRSNLHDKKWYADAIPKLYARQVAKLQNRKSLMELPYSINGIYDTDEIEAEYLSYLQESKTIVKPNSQISGEEILENELFGE